MTQAASQPTPTPDDRPHRPADDSEVVYFEGSPLLRAEMGKVLLWGLAGILVMVPPVWNVVSWHHQWPIWIYPVCLAIAALLICMPMLLRKTLRYRITNYRIDVTSGVLSRNVDTVELWHVEDLRLHQSLINRIVGVGLITITSHDQGLPVLPLHGLPKPRELFTMLEQRVIAVKRQRGVMKVDPG